jgi:hypothetical protein
VLHGDDDQIVRIGDSALLSVNLVTKAALVCAARATHYLEHRINEELLAFIQT